MRIISDITGCEYKTVDECLAAEKKFLEEKARKEEAAKELEAKKDEAVLSLSSMTTVIRFIIIMKARLMKFLKIFSMHGLTRRE